MTKHTTKILIAVLAAMLAAGPSFAAKSKDADGKASKSGWMLKRLSHRLDLSEDQQSKFEKAFKAHQEEVKPLRKEKREAMRKLRKQIRGEEKDKDVQATLDSLKKVERSIQAARDKFQSEIDGVLKPTQQAKMLLAKSMFSRKGFGRGQGPGWGGGPGHGRGRGPGARGGQGW